MVFIIFIFGAEVMLEWSLVITPWTIVAKIKFKQVNANSFTFFFPVKTKNLWERMEKHVWLFWTTGEMSKFVKLSFHDYWITGWRRIQSKLSTTGAQRIRLHLLEKIPRCNGPLEQSHFLPWIVSICLIYLMWLNKLKGTHQLDHTISFFFYLVIFRLFWGIDEKDWW